MRVDFFDIRSYDVLRLYSYLFQTCEDPVNGVSNGRNKNTDHEMATINVKETA